ncbi:MAG TPA: FUSC family protein, partial [Acidimicrobiales bacterium]|nr:FUSC family protein [Acidimicrobiales bacterium]
AGDALDFAALTLSSPSLFRRPELAPLRGLVEEGRRVRIELAALSGLRSQLVRLTPSDRERGPDTERLDAALDNVASFFTGVAQALWRRQPGPLPEVPLPEVVTLAGTEGDGAASSPEPSAQGGDRRRAAVIRRSVGEHLSALAGQMRAIDAMTERLSARRPPRARAAEPGAESAPGATVAIGDVARRIGAEIEVLQADLTPRSTAFRHALRLAGVVVAAEAVGHYLPLERGYWVAVTAAIVLRPDFSSTWTRGIARLAGTLLGAGLVGLLAETLHPSGASAVAAIGVLAFAAYLTFPASYACFTVFITGLVILLVTLVTPGTLTPTADRVLDTLIGGAMALVAYALWPSWSATDARRSLHDLVAAQRDYLSAVLSSVTGIRTSDGPGSVPLPGLARRMRLARSNAEAAVERALGEPTTHGLERVWTSGILDALRRISLVAHALRPSKEQEQMKPAAAPAPGRHDDSAVGSFILAVSASLGQIAASVGSGVPPGELPPLRTLHEEMASEVGPRPNGAFFMVETDELVDAVDTAAGLALAQDHR